jgi:GT2 family glycosyltransferase
MSQIATTRRLDIRIGIATTGRAETLTHTLQQIARQQRLPDELILCPAEASDYKPDDLASLPYPVRVVFGGRGLVVQRNTILTHCETCDVVVFFDDDFYPAIDYLARMERIFQAEPDVVGMTGDVLADGSTTAGVAHEAALAILEDAPADELTSLSDVYNLYGCNMAVRMAPVRRHDLRFDPNLPLYGWLEDLDFTRQVGRHGRLVKCNSLRGVHLANKRGRSSGVRLGYSQVSNPLYLMQKGTMAPTRALRQIGRNVAANAYHYFAPEPWVDRKGRLQGNALAAFDWLRGRLDPRKIVALDS